MKHNVCVLELTAKDRMRTTTKEMASLAEKFFDTKPVV
jgi:hypothetical protein